MKKILLWLALIFAIQSRAQIITGCEYFFDTDPGVGNGTALAVIPGDSIILSTTVPTVSLSNGFHKMFVRVKNVNGVWSLYEGRSFYIQNTVSATFPQLSAAEYFYDTDPGVGNGTAFTVTTGDSIIINTTVPTTSLSNGFHRLYVRAKNLSGQWSLYEGRTFYIQTPVNPSLPQLSTAEYFYDTDPGIGNATAFTVTTGDSLVINTTVPTTSLPDGFHRLFVRAKNTNEKWSLYEGRTFYIQNNINPNVPVITDAEYFFDTEPGIGSGTALAITAGDSVDANFIIPQSLALGNHNLFLRFKNSAGVWSLYEGRDFTDSIVGINEFTGNETVLFQNYPNPFSNATTIEYYLQKNSDVMIYVTDVLGNVVKEIRNENRNPGKYVIKINDHVLNAGYYFYKMVTADFTDTKRMIVLR